MPTGTTSNLFLSIALKTEAADNSETSCSPLRPPKRIPIRSFFMTHQSVRRAASASIAGLVRGSPNKKTEPPQRLRITSDQQLYCTVRVTIVVCITAPDVAVTATDAVPR